MQHLENDGVRRNIVAVLRLATGHESPVVQARENIVHRVGGAPEHGEEVVVCHRPWQPSLAIRRHSKEGRLAVIDVAGFVADLKDHAVDHGFHVHDERHFVETYSLRQAWEVDLHPEEACGGPLDLQLSLEVDPRVLLAFEDHVTNLEEEDRPEDEYQFKMIFTWALPPLRDPPDLLVLATDVAGVGGTTLPLEVTALDSIESVTDAPERSLSIVARVDISLSKVYLGEENLCDTLDKCLAVSQFLLERAPHWLKEE